MAVCIAVAFVALDVLRDDAPVGLDSVFFRLLVGRLALLLEELCDSHWLVSWRLTRLRRMHLLRGSGRALHLVLEFDVLVLIRKQSPLMLASHGGHRVTLLQVTVELAPDHSLVFDD